MPNWPKDTQAARNAFYGDPGKGEIARQMVPVVPPFAMYYEGKKVKAIQFHRLAAPALLAAFNEIWDYCGHDQARIDAAGVSNYNGAYNHRLVRGSSTKWSNHAYATAIDLNAGQNALGVKKGTMPQFVVDAFCRQGAMWGGWYTSRPDWMHFEFVDNGGRKPKSPPPVWPPVAVGLIAQPSDAPADEFERDGETTEPFPDAPVEEAPAPPVSPPPTTSSLLSKVATLRTVAGVAAGTLTTGQVVKSTVDPVAEVAEQVSTVATKSGEVVSVTKQIVAIPKPGFWFGVLQFVTSPTFIVCAVLVAAAAWAVIWAMQRQQAKAAP